MEKVEEKGSRLFVELGAAVAGALIAVVLIWLASCGPEPAESKTKRAAQEAPTTTTVAPPMPTTTCPPPVEPTEPVE